jgi:hypothetical protein
MEEPRLAPARNANAPPWRNLTLRELRSWSEAANCREGTSS